MSPSRSFRICNAPGCPELVRGGGYCEKHAEEKKQRERQRFKEQYAGNDDRGKQLRFYGSARWKRIRTRKLAKDPFCQIIRDDGLECGDLATDCHHKNWNWQDNNDENLLSVCGACHDRLRKQKKDTLP
jgi:hypothetical protein